MGRFVLQGGGEFAGSMRDSDLRAIELAGGPEVAVSIIPAAAAPDNNHARAGESGRLWFKSLGVVQPDVLPLVDRSSANAPELVSKLTASRLIYLLGGFPGYLQATLNGSAALEAIREALRAGAVVAGSSAGAMVLCRQFYDPLEKKMVAGLGFLTTLCILPHHNRLGAQWADPIQRKFPHLTLVGIDEETGLVSDAPLKQWRVYGRGGVTRYRGGQVDQFSDGACVDL